MRIWSLHPKYLDTKGLLAVWRETLLAKNVLEGKTKGYKNHPQLIRFKKCQNPIMTINYYLETIYNESLIRGFAFNNNKFIHSLNVEKIPVTTGQVEYEKKHLLNKLKIRDIASYNLLKIEANLLINSTFTLIKGDVEAWEII